MRAWWAIIDALFFAATSHLIYFVALLKSGLVADMSCARAVRNG